MISSPDMPSSGEDGGIEPAAEAGRDRTGQDHVVVAGTPLDEKRAAVEEHGRSTACPGAAMGGHEGGAGARTAGARDADPALPHAHAERAVAQAGGHLDVDALGEERMM